MPPFTLPDDLSLAEFETPFPTTDALIEFIFDRENDCLAYKVLRMHLMNYAFSTYPHDTDWNAILHDLRRYPELPHLSLAAHELYRVFCTGRHWLNS